MAKELKHYGIARRSGRYPWGSGKDPLQRSSGFLGYVKDLKDKGLTEKEIATGVGMTIKELRAVNSFANDTIKRSNISFARRLKDKGYSNVAIGEKMGRNESYVRTLLKDTAADRANITQQTADILRDRVTKREFIDVGAGVERHLGISKDKLNTAIAKLKDEEGYTVHYVKVEQLGTGKETTVKVLAKEGVHTRDVYANREKISVIDARSEDGGRTYEPNLPINNVSGKRVLIRYGDEGGSQKDGVIELRRDVEDIDLGKSKYAQVRVSVDGTHYMKGMAVYADQEIPKGYDMIYNTNKPKGTPPEKVYKEMSDDSTNPFGATVRQKTYIDKKGDKKRSSLNIVNEEGDWDTWSRNVSSQVLSKQSVALAKKQLGLAYDSKKEEFDSIMNLTNPVVKKKLLAAFADGADSAAVHLKAAALPRQGSHVLIPITSMKDNEVYAPNYRDGEKVALIRYPHGGIFEIPELTVNNKHPVANKIMKQAKDAIGINANVAERMSGADFDGDTVLVIPNNGKSIKNSPPLQALKNFDPKDYKLPEDAPRLSNTAKQKLMGDVSNLITDMTIKGANEAELARAVKHSMVVIDAEKHHLDYKQSFRDNNIAKLKEDYQGGAKRGASTLISKASSEERTLYRVEGEKQISPLTGKERRVYIDPRTGKKLYEYTGESYVNKQGKTVYRTTKSTKMYETEDAFELSSGTPMENTYATHANKLKALGNEARKAYVDIEPIPYSKKAKETYAKEVDSLNTKLDIALKNAPIERQAQILANSLVNQIKEANPDMDGDSLKKLKGQKLDEARRRTGAGKIRIDITPKEWEAIQAGAISTSKLESILNNTNLDKVKALATPREKKTLSRTTETRARAMIRSGYTQAEIADHLGVSVGSISSLIDD